MTDNLIVPSAPPAEAPAPAPPRPAPAPSGVPDYDPKHPYWNSSSGEHKAAVAAVVAGFEQAHPTAEPWRDDALERPGLRDHQAPYLLEPPQPGTPWAPEDRRAVSNTFDAIAEGSKPLAQQALDWLENSPAADRPPDLPAGYAPPDPSASLAELRRGWGAKAEENLHLARAVVAVYDAQKQGQVGDSSTAQVWATTRE